MKFTKRRSGRTEKSVTCAVEKTLAVLAGRWKVLALFHLLSGTRRFNELHRLLRGVSHRTLSRQLRELERDGVIRRTVYPQVPPRVEYALTPLGETLRPVLAAMHEWGAVYSQRVQSNGAT